MRRRKLYAVFAILFSFVLVFAACESSGGVNLDRVLKSAIVQESYEGKSSLKLEVISGSGQGNSLLEESGLGMLAAFPLEIEIFDYKQENLSTASSKGNLHIAGMTIPFAMSSTIDELVIEVDGIERPLVMNMLSVYDEMGIAYDKEQLEEMSIGLATAFYDYLIPNLPNPETLDISSTTISINGTTQNVRQIHAEVSGEEILGMLEKLISNLIADEEGLRQALDTLYNLFVPYLIDVLKSVEAEEDPDFLNYFLAYLNNKTLITEFLYTTITQTYATAAKDLGAVQALFGPAESSFLTDASYAKVDLYIDGNLNIIRSDFDLFLATGSSAEEGGIAISTVSEKWNINKPIEAELISSQNGIDLESYNVEDEILSAIDAESLLGQILSALGLNQKTHYVWIEHDDVYVESGTTMMELYDLVSLLGVELDWETLFEGSVKLSSGTTTVELPLGQNRIIIDGVAQEIPLGAVESDSGFYVPLRAVAEAFGYEVSWDAVYNTVDLTKIYF